MIHSESTYPGPGMTSLDEYESKYEAYYIVGIWDREHPVMLWTQIPKPQEEENVLYTVIEA